MHKKLIKITLGAFALSLLWFFALRTDAQVVSNSCSSLKMIYKNVDVCDGQNITLTGKVKKPSFRISKNGSRYTIFILQDIANIKIKVFSYGYLPIHTGNIIRVSGIFNKESLKKDYPAEIATNIKNILVLKTVHYLRNILLLIILFVAIIAFLIYRLHKRNKDKVYRNTGVISRTISTSLMPSRPRRTLVATGLYSNTNSAQTRRSTAADEMHYEMGIKFESYIMSLFNKNDWSIVDYTKDLSKKLHRRVESDSDPDFTMRHKITDNIVSIECKYRSKITYIGSGYGVKWAKSYQIRNYNEFSKRTKYTVFVVIGIGGLPSNPEKIFILPLSCLKDPFVGIKYLEKFKRNSKNIFTIEGFEKLDQLI